MLQRICTPPPQSFLPVSWPQLSSEQIKACHSHVSLQVRCILCSTMGSNPKLSLSAHFRVRFWGLHYPIPLHHTFHMTWKCLSWQNLQISFSTLNSSMVLIKDAVCVQVRRDMDRHEAGRTNWNLVVSGCGMLQTAPKARCLQEHFQNRVGFVSGRSTGLSWSAWVAQVLIRIYIHKIHTKRNRCFTTHTCITPLIAWAMPKNPAYSLACICLWLGWLPDQALRLPRPQLCAPSYVPIGPFERRALMCLHNAAITSTILRQINQRQYNSQIQRIPNNEVRLSNSYTDAERERDIYTQRHILTVQT